VTQLISCCEVYQTELHAFSLPARAPCLAHLAHLDLLAHMTWRIKWRSCQHAQRSH